SPTVRQAARTNEKVKYCSFQHANREDKRVYLNIKNQSISLRWFTAEHLFSETQLARASILPVPYPRTTPASRRFSAVCRRKSETRCRPSHKTRRRADRSLSTCNRPDCGANRCAPGMRLLSRGSLLDLLWDRLLREVLPTYAGSWEETLPHGPTTRCA